MDKEYYVVLVLALALMAAFALIQIIPMEENVVGSTCSKDSRQSRIMLPEPSFKGKVLEDAISERRSERNFSSENITLDELSMLLWAGNGITGGQGFRSAPSAGALYPIDIYVVPSRVDNASCGVYRYLPADHELILIKEGEFSESFRNISYGQSHIGNAAVLLVLISTPERTTGKYGNVGEEYVLIEAGHISQNILLEGTSLDIKTVPVGGFGRQEAGIILNLDQGKEAIYIIAAGK